MEIEYFDIGSELLTNEENFMRLDWTGVSTAVIIAVLTAVAGYLATLSTLVSFDWKALGIIALSAFIGTLAQKLGTNPQTEKFAGFAPSK